EEDISRHVIKVDFTLLRVDPVAIEKTGVPDQVNRNSAGAFGLENRKPLGAMTESCISDLGHGSGLELPQQRSISGKDNHRLSTGFFERQWQRPDHIPEAALLGPWRNFRSDDRNLHFETATSIVRKVSSARIPQHENHPQREEWSVARHF